MNDRDVIAEIRPKTRMWEISSLLHSLVNWDKYKVSVTCLMSLKPQLVVMVKDWEQVRQAEATFLRKQQQLEKEVEEATETYEKRVEKLKQRKKKQIKDPRPSRQVWRTSQENRILQ